MSSRFSARPPGAMTSAGTGTSRAASPTGRRSPKTAPIASTLGVRAVDDLTIEVTTATPKPYLPSVVSLWYPVPKHMVDQHGDDYATNVETLVSSGPFVVESWEKSNNAMVLVRNPTYTGPWPSRVDRVEIDPSLGAPEVGLPAFMAGEVDFATLTRDKSPSSSSAIPRPCGRTPSSPPPTSPSTSSCRRSTTRTCARPSTTRLTATS